MATVAGGTLLLSALPCRLHLRLRKRRRRRELISCFSLFSLGLLLICLSQVFLQLHHHDGGLGALSLPDSILFELERVLCSVVSNQPLNLLFLLVLGPEQDGLDLREVLEEGISQLDLDLLQLRLPLPASDRHGASA